MALLSFALALLALALSLDRAFYNWQHCKRPVKTQKPAKHMQNICKTYAKHGEFSGETLKKKVFAQKKIVQYRRPSSTGNYAS
jgi:hypothetical protein